MGVFHICLNLSVQTLDSYVWRSNLLVLVRYTKREHRMWETLRRIQTKITSTAASAIFLYLFFSTYRRPPVILLRGPHFNLISGTYSTPSNYRNGHITAVVLIFDVRSMNKKIRARNSSIKSHWQVFGSKVVWNSEKNYLKIRNKNKFYRETILK